MTRPFFHQPDELTRFLQRGSWIVPAVLAAAALFTVHVMLPLLAHDDPVLFLIGVAATPFGWLFAVLCAGLSVVRYVHRHDNASASPKDGEPPAPGAPDSPPPGPPAATRERSDRFQSCASPAPQRPREWSLDVLARIEWKRFEDLCCAFYREKGIRAQTVPLGPDGGIDIRLFQDPRHPERATAIVQCKALSGLVDLAPVHHLHEVMAAEQVDKAFFMAPSGFSDAARAFALEQRIVLLDGRLFLAMLDRLPAESAARLLEFATEGDWTVPTCPDCGVKLVARQGEQGMTWRCRLYPNCRCEIPMATAEAAEAV